MSGRLSLAVFLLEANWLCRIARHCLVARTTTPQPLAGQPVSASGCHLPVGTAAPAAPATLRPEGSAGAAPVQPLPGMSPSVPRPSIARVTSGSGNLPMAKAKSGASMISRPTRSACPGKKPESAIVDWILRETGYEAWHGDVVTVQMPIAMCCASFTRPRSRRSSTTLSIGS